MNCLKTNLLSIIGNRYLIKELIRRDISGKYRGSAMGLLWSFVNPVLMLMVYTFFFSTVFKARWTEGPESKGEFALILFAGLIAFNFFSECVNRSSGLLIANANYVKKIIFPVEILVVVNAGSALFHAMVSLAVWFLFSLFVFGTVHATALLLPLVFLPLVFLTLGITWIFSALGVYLRDLGQFVTIVIAVMPFTTTIFFPITALPEAFRKVMYLNPLTLTIEHIRDLLVWGSLPNLATYAAYLCATAAFALAGLAFFVKCKRGFSDVL